MRYIALLHIIVLMLILVATACGRKGDPRPPDFKNQNANIKYQNETTHFVGTP